MSANSYMRTDETEPEDSSSGLEAAIECETAVREVHDLPSPESCERFDAPVIATIHDLSQESDLMRLTESELQLGKSKPYWIPDDDCTQTQARVCTPCAAMLVRIEQYEKTIKENAERNPDDASPSTSSGNRTARGVLKTRAPKSLDLESQSSETSDTVERKRSVVFRDGVKPGATTPVNGVEFGMDEKNTAVKPKKKSRKRHVVTRRVAELRLEDELACALPTPTRPNFLIINSNGEMAKVDEDFTITKLKEGLPVTVVLKKNLTCVAKICEVDSMSVFCVHSCGFASIGLDEIYSTSCDADQAGVRQVCTRLPAIHSVPIALSPLPRHILFFPPTLQDFTSLSIPSSPFLIALFLHDAELSWAMACPNRLLFRLGLKYSWTLFIHTETSQTVLKVFTDFHSWSFRMKHLVGCTVTLSNDVTLVEIPKCAKNDLDEIISLNRTMIAWATSVNLSADSHLVCDEADGFYSTQVFARESTRQGKVFLISVLNVYEVEE
ncbi:hypothetical protein KIN20_028564 [Parelaphostrongylus tenuis]|uniref:Smad anchor for receptor activation-like C-terminal domain-containing protein n=1 Tax=Parelaphostrongylus tenuis TaxID=148309 RepID=A0AAD5R114_PARTN|nr:hypothetical protein KIN20_028564 [Parelaphostrongylus tenuis]